jgi:cytoplasmic tRNA 2-thiolation protein 1
VIETVKCSFCDRREAVFARAYSGEKLCKSCFCKSIENRVRVTIADYDMFKFDNRILVAVSGGKDSVGLLHILARIEKNFPRVSLHAVSVDEGISGYRNEALKIATENCETLNITHSIFSFKNFFGLTLDEIVSKTKKMQAHASLTPCAYCGVLRRKALNLAAERLDANVIALGHNLDDVDQTFLLNIVHGDIWHLTHFNIASPDSGGRFIRRVRPLCLVPERETAFYAYVKRIEFQTAPCPYASEALRNDMRFWLNRLEQRHAGSLFTLFRSFEKIGKSMELKSKVFGVCRKCGEACAEGEDFCMVCNFLKALGIE